MNKDIETRMKELRLTAPSPELKSKVLSNARSVWREEGNGTILHMQFRSVLAIAASLVLFIGIIAILNHTEDRNTRTAMNPYWLKNKISSENIKFLDDMGLGPDYGKVIAGISEIKHMKPFVDRLSEFKL